MSTTNHISTELATLDYISEYGIVHHRFLQPIGGEAFRNVLTTGVELLRRHGGTKWLSDDRGNTALSPEDTEWSKTSWFPSAKAAGWKYWALVVPADIYARINLTEFVESYYEQGLRIMVFTDPKVAMDWLVKIDVPAS